MTTSDAKIIEDAIFNCLKDKFVQASLDEKRNILKMSSLPQLTTLLLQTLTVAEFIKVVT